VYSRSRKTASEHSTTPEFDGSLLLECDGLCSLVATWLEDVGVYICRREARVDRLRRNPVMWVWGRDDDAAECFSRGA
jgi:hypothetical protein